MATLDDANRAASYEDSRYESIGNPNHPIADEIAKPFALLQSHELDEIARRQKLAMLARPTKEERESFAEIHAQPLGIEDMKSMRVRSQAAREKYANRVSKIDKTGRADPGGCLRPQLDWQPRAPAAGDHTFWWANTIRHAAPGLTHRVQADGIHFDGSIFYNSDPLMAVSFGAVALFEVQWERIPPTSTGRYLSAPYVEVFGSVRGWTASLILSGDAWCKCWMVRKQTVYQVGFGGNVIRGEAEDVENLLFEENESRWVDRALRGFYWMPPVSFGGLFIGSVWSRVEVRFDLQLEGTAMFLPEDVLLRTFQWPLVAL